MIETALLANWISLTLLWLISLRIKDSSIIDIYWGFGFVLICWVCLLINQNDGLIVSMTQWALVSMVTIWGLRLTFYLAKRNLGHGEDYRYTKMRNSSKKDWRIVSYFRVFMLQAFFKQLLQLQFLSYSVPTKSVTRCLLFLSLYFYLLWDFYLSLWQINK